MSGPTRKISRTELRDALQRSGYLLENRLEAILGERGWAATVNRPYPDASGKSQELDLSAFRLAKAGPRRGDWLGTTLLIECVNNPQPVAFIRRHASWPIMHLMNVRTAGRPQYVLATNGDQNDGTGKSEWVLAHYGVHKYHHYCTSRIATQFCSFTPKKGERGSTEWMAQHVSEHHEVFQKLSAVLDYETSQHQPSGGLHGVEGVRLDALYPVLVLQGELIEVIPTKRSFRLVKSDHVAYQRSVMREGDQITYQFDVVTERYFPKYLTIVEQELDTLATSLVEDSANVTRSVRAETVRR